MKVHAGRKELFVTISVFALLLLLDAASSRGVTGGGGSAGNYSGVGGRTGSSFGGRFGRNTNTGNSGATEPQVQTPSGSQSKLTGAYLIPGNGGTKILPIYPHPQEVKSYYKREGTGMSAWGIIALILGIVGGGTVAWFCYMVGIPIWRDRKRRNMLMMSDSMRRPGHEGIPLQETPSTATPSP